MKTLIALGAALILYGCGLDRAEAKRLSTGNDATAFCGDRYCGHGTGTTESRNLTRRDVKHSRREARHDTRRIKTATTTQPGRPWKGAHKRLALRAHHRGLEPIPHPPPASAQAKPLLPPSPMELAKQAVETVNLFARYFLSHSRNAPTDRLPAPLKAKLAEIQDACPRFQVISTVCGPGAHSWNVAGTRRPSLHCSGKAADFRVANYGCAYAHLRNWRGGMSIDPQRVAHIHLSYAPGSHEFGIRFAHGGGRMHARRYARHHQRKVHWARA